MKSGQLGESKKREGNEHPDRYVSNLERDARRSKQKLEAMKIIRLRGDDLGPMLRH